MEVESVIFEDIEAGLGQMSPFDPKIILNGSFFVERLTKEKWRLESVAGKWLMDAPAEEVVRRIRSDIGL